MYISGCDMYISILVSSSVIISRWNLTSVTGHIQIYVGIGAFINLFINISSFSVTFGNHIHQELFVYLLLSRVHLN